VAENLIKMLPTRRAEMIDHSRRLVEHCSARLHLAVKRAQRIQLHAFATLAAEFLLMRAQVLAQPRHVRRPALFVAHAIDEQAHTADANFGQDLRQQTDDFGVDERLA
jgi:hypothetical protein